MSKPITRKYPDKLTYDIIGAAIEVHKALGPGLLESVYQKCLEHEFRLRDIQFVSQVFTSLVYKRLDVGAELRLDILVENCIAVELKAISEIAPIHEATLLSYMKTLKFPKGILINFNCMNIWKDGQRTYVNEYFNELV